MLRVSVSPRRSLFRSRAGGCSPESAARPSVEERTLRVKVAGVQVRIGPVLAARGAAVVPPCDTASAAVPVPVNSAANWLCCIVIQANPRTLTRRSNFAVTHVDSEIYIPVSPLTDIYTVRPRLEEARRLFCLRLERTRSQEGGEVCVCAYHRGVSHRCGRTRLDEGTT